MRNYTNIEPCGYRKGVEYIGYGGGKVWHIERYGKQAWKAHTPDWKHVEYADTLRTLSEVLEGVHHD